MKWRNVKLVTTMMVTFLFLLVLSCATKKRTVDVVDFSQNLRSSVAHQRHSFQDTITFLHFESTNSGVELVPVAQMRRSARHEETETIGDTSSRVGFHHGEQKKTRQPATELPSWMNVNVYDLLLAIVAILIILKLTRHH